MNAQPVTPGRPDANPLWFSLRDARVLKVKYSDSRALSFVFPI